MEGVESATVEALQRSATGSSAGFGQPRKRSMCSLDGAGAAGAAMLEDQMLAGAADRDDDPDE